MRVWDERGFIPFEVEVLTPVHVGSGEDFSPLEYVVAQPREGIYEIWLIDTAAWLGASHASPKVAKALEDGDMATLRSQLNGSLDLSSYVLAKIPVSTPGLGAMLLKKRASIADKAEIMGFSRNPFTRLAYLPASSLKGALSTPLVDFLNEKRKGIKMPGLREAPARNYQKIMAEMFGRIDAHAMQALRMADIGLAPRATSIREAIGVDLAPGSKPMPKTPLETLNPAQTEGIFGNMRLAVDNGRPVITLPDRQKISFSQLCRICNDFYRQRFEAELGKFYSKPQYGATARLLEPVAKRISALDMNEEMLLRVGRYSHIECVTVSGQAPRDAKGGPGTSRTLADQALPFGWIILKKCSMEAYEKGLAAVDRAAAREVELIRSAGAAARDQAEAARAAAEREEAERKRSEMLAAMSPDERMLWELEQPDAIENTASEIYRKLPELGDLQERAALALMRFWQKIGKWEGKSLTKRQKEKVAAVRALLEK